MILKTVVVDTLTSRSSSGGSSPSMLLSENELQYPPTAPKTNDPVKVVAWEPFVVDEHSRTTSEGLTDLENTDEHDPAADLHLHSTGDDTRVEAEEGGVADALNKDDPPCVPEPLDSRSEGALDGTDTVQFDLLVVPLDGFSGKVDNHVGRADGRHDGKESQHPRHHTLDASSVSSRVHSGPQYGGEDEGQDTTKGVTKGEGSEVVNGSEGGESEG
ncbi:death-associated kinase 1-like protein, putative [Babesia ovata]|uniref:Death-associated kinase 1-like protein, putative n=1 Tax=Babesia ovata TaxID=189622 RepID=A0A2H6KHR4_9APIC|nr:death-associated kinase 1-like protein, putative [Babesia ovata]GBE62521.1 death-associated kinase 1-like protein, putative [Babesia ovata]